MKMVLFGDEESKIMFNLIGIDGIVYDYNEQNFEERFNELLDDDEIGIIIITESVFIRHREYILPIKMTRRTPIIIDIPELVPKYKEDFTSEMIKKFITL